MSLQHARRLPHRPPGHLLLRLIAQLGLGLVEDALQIPEIRLLSPHVLERQGLRRHSRHGHARQREHGLLADGDLAVHLALQLRLQEIGVRRAETQRVARHGHAEHVPHQEVRRLVPGDAVAILRGDARESVDGHLE